MTLLVDCVTDDDLTMTKIFFQIKRTLDCAVQDEDSDDEASQKQHTVSNMSTEQFDSVDITFFL